MGVVYRAEDERLRRPVALKVLPPNLVGDEERRRRFLREARAAAAVTHPNIATVYEVGEVPEASGEGPGLIFIAMELVEGKTLQGLIGGRQLPIKEAIRIGAEIADGLARAHGARLIHRDLKPANILVDGDGHPKILDFGLAKQVRGDRASGSSQAGTMSVESTRAGTIYGTPAYMSPEQARGEALDARTDLFSFGIVLHEMVTGTLPFKGSTSADVLSAIIRDTPVPPSRINPEVSADLERIIGQCLEKDVRDRYQHADQIVADLGRLRRAGDAATKSLASDEASGVASSGSRRSLRWGAWAGIAAGVLLLAGVVVVWLAWNGRRIDSGAGAGKPASEPMKARETTVASIAVLPFVNMSGDKDNEYFSDGMAEELLNALAKNPALHVAARTSSFSFKGKEVDVAEIGRRLNVASIVEGSVRKQGDQVRITVQLVNAADGYHIWSETYDRRLENIFDVQDDITRSVMSSLKASLPDAGTAGQRTGNIEAYNLRLRADYFWWRSNPGDLEKARDLYKRALALEPGNARAWLMLGWTYLNMVGEGTLSPEEGSRLARDATERALALNDSQAGAHAQLGFQKMFYDWDWTGAEAELNKARALDPRDLAVFHTTAQLATVRGRLKDASELLRQYLEIDPLNKLVLGSSVLNFLAEGRLEEGLANARILLDLDAKREGAHALVGSVLLAQNKTDAALQEFLQETSQPSRLYGLVQVYHVLGRKADSNGALAEYAKLKGASAYGIACLHAVRGEVDEAFAWLDRAYVKHDLNLIWLKTDPDLANLRADPRWPPLLRKMRLAD